jgi:hypothetical protein
MFSINLAYVKNNLLLVIILEAVLELCIFFRQFRKCRLAKVEPVRPFLRQINMTPEEYKLNQSYNTHKVCLKLVIIAFNCLLNFSLINKDVYSSIWNYFVKHN